MDLKGIPWVGNLCQKFESFYAEFDETVYQETAKYVDNHMRTVKVTFNKVYTDVIHDFRPSSPSSPVEEGILNEVVNTNEEDAQMVKSADDIAYTNNIVNDSSYSSTEEEKVSEETEEMVKSCDDTPNSDNVADDKSCYSSATPMLNVLANKDSGEKFTFSDAPKGNIGSKSTSVVDQDSHSEDDEAQISDEVTEGNGSSDDFEVSIEETTMPFSLSLSKYLDERSNLMSAEKIKDNHAGSCRISVTEQVEKVNPGQSCVLVQNNEYPLTLPLRNKHKSNKKTIQNMFSRRRWPKGKQAEDSGKNMVSVHIDSHSSDSLDSDYLFKNEYPLTLPLQNKLKSYKKTVGNVFSRRWSKGKQAEDNGKNEVVHSDSHSSDSLDSDWELI